MKLLFFAELILIIFVNIKISYGNEIQNGLYIIKNKDNLNLCIKNSSLYFTSEESCQFLIIKKETKLEHEYDFVPEEDKKSSYYYIEDEKTGKRINFNGITESISAVDETDSENDDSSNLWEIIPKNKNKNDDIYQIKSKLTKKKYFISYENTEANTKKVLCESSWTSFIEGRENIIKFVQIYHLKENNQDLKILDKEPIDVVIKYIDLNDTNLNRKNLEQIDKDYHNNELKYCLRSIFKNIPWIRKIFIIMPNEEIPFLKSHTEINEKIIYIKDSDLLGFESSSPPAFQFNLHQLKKYNLSENFILMDDDYFISQPLKKSDLFYEEKGKVYPLLISTKYIILDSDRLQKTELDNIDNIDDINYHSKEGFDFRRTSSLSFIHKIFDDNYDNNTLIEVGFTHNAIPLKISDVEEVFDLIEDKYKYSEYCLRGNKRTIRNLQPQIMFMNYAKNKYNRPVNKISWKYYELSEVDKVNLDTQLFVINKETKKYDKDIYIKEEKALEKFFPNAIKYEKDYVETKNDKNNNENMINDYVGHNENIEKTKEELKEEQHNENKKDKEEDKNNEEQNNENQNVEQNNEIPQEEPNVNKDNEEIDKEKEEDNNNDENSKEKKDENNQKYQEVKNELDLFEQKLMKMEKEITYQKNEYYEKINNIDEEIKVIKNQLKNNSSEESKLINKLQNIIETQKELGEKFSSLENDNKELKKIQKELSEKIIEKVQDMNDKEQADNTLKQIFNDIQDKNLKLEEKINKLSEENSALKNKLDSIQTSKDEDKNSKISKLTEENEGLKSQIGELETKISTINKDLENVNFLETLGSQNQEKINLLNKEITLLKQKIEEKKIGKEEELKGKDDKNNKKTNDNYSSTYIILFVFICVISIYCIYRIFYGKDDGNSQKNRHMKLSSLSGYGSISSSYFS